MSALAARDPAERVELLIRLTGRLTELLEKETAAFEARRPQDTEPFRQEKSDLANVYRHEIGRIGKDRSLIETAPADRRAALAEATRRFDAALEANRRSGEALRVISEGIVQSVAAEVARRRGAEGGYGPRSRGAEHAAASAITLNKSV